MEKSFPEHLEPSEVGTKDYWDHIYTTELANHGSYPTDEGTVWFSDAGAEEKMLEYLERLSDEGFLEKDTSHENGGTSLIDLGTGNGHLLIALRDDGWRGRLLGVDYSENSVQLARNVWNQRKMAILEQTEEQNCERGKDDDFVEQSREDHLTMEDIAFTQWDMLKDVPGDWLVDGFDVALDKGTFDAISLSAEVDTHGNRIVESYRTRVERLIKPGGRLLITSCNWTEEELRGWLEAGKLKFEGKVTYPSFTFGGKSGSKVVTLCFRKEETAP